jgi:hypothetical protein
MRGYSSAAVSHIHCVVATTLAGSVGATESKASAGRHRLLCHVRDPGFQGGRTTIDAREISCLSVVRDAILRPYHTKYPQPIGCLAHRMTFRRDDNWFPSFPPFQNPSSKAREDTIPSRRTSRSPHDNDGVRIALRWNLSWVCQLQLPASESRTILYISAAPGSRDPVPSRTRGCRARVRSPCCR